MSWYRGQDMRPDQENSSRAETNFLVFLQLNRPDLLVGLRSNERVPLINNDGEADGLSIPDFLWSDPRPCNIAFYLDGEEVHNGIVQTRRDNRVRGRMEKQGWLVKGWPYRPPLSEKEMRKIVAWVDERFKEAMANR